MYKIKVFFTFFRELVRFAKFKILLSFIFTVFLGLTHGISLLMLIPFLSLAGLDTPSGKPSFITDFIQNSYGYFDIPFTLISALIFYISIISIFALIKFFQTNLNVQISQGFTRVLRNKLHFSIINSNWLFINQNKSSAFGTTLISHLQMVSGGTNQFIQTAGNIIIAIVYTIFAFLMSPNFSLFALLCGFILLIIQIPLNKKSFKTGKSTQFSMKEFFEAVNNHLSGMKIAKSNNAENSHHKSFKSLTFALEKHFKKFTQIRALSSFIFEVGAVISISLFFYYTVEIKKIPVAELLVIIYIFARLLPIISRISKNWQNILNMLPIFNSVEILLSESEKQQETKINKPNFEINLKNNIRFEDVCFSYPSGNFALKNINFKIKKGETISISGKSGSGKSTLADIFLGLLKPNSGNIYIDKIKSNEIPIKSLRKIIGYVPQDTFLFHDTIKSNLLWANPDASENEINDALKKASAYNFVQNLPEKLNTIVGDRGTMLSGGERQRITLARTILQNPQILILDEATSALDKINEKIIQDAIKELHGKITIIIIAHSKSTTEIADKIIKIEDGKIIK